MAALGSNVVRVTLDDFTGGWMPRLHAAEFSERQWADLYGVVIESPTELRTQWALQRIGDDVDADGFDELGYVDGRMVARKPDGSGGVEWWWNSYPASQMTDDMTRDMTWEQISGMPSDPDLHIVCQIPLDRDDVGYKQALLINGRDRDGSAYAIYFPGNGPSLHEFDEKWPGAGDVMPPANVGVMWHDFLVLGDIRWLDDEDDDLDDDNNRPHPTAVWQSKGGKVDEWDVLDVTWATFAFSPGGAEVRKMIPVDAGLLILTGAGIALLRGRPGEDANGDPAFEFEPLRTEIGASAAAATYWPHTGAAVWVDVAGGIWQTNGEEFAELTDQHYRLPRTADSEDSVAALSEYLLYAHQGRLFAIRAFDHEGAWTELHTPNGSHVEWLMQVGDQLYMLNDDGEVWRFNRRDDLDGDAERGLVSKEMFEARVATRTMARDGGHEVGFWHRVGLRCEGPGTVKRAVLRPGPALDDGQPTLTYELGQSADTRHDVMVRGHGPSAEASVEWTLEGDVRVEQVEWLVHRGRGKR